MKIKLTTLTIQTFKGIRNLTISFSPILTDIQGDNATGKTTIYDAFLWILFGKDSQGKTDFEILPLKDGKRIHNVEAAVEAELVVDDKPIKLKRVFKEKWTKRTGEGNKELTGHTTKFYWNDVPIKKTEYQQRIADIIDESLFKLLTNIYYFPNLHWEKRREILFNIFGDVSEEEILEGELTELYNVGPIEDYRKKLLNQRKQINERLKEIPARLDELKKSIKQEPLPDLESLVKRRQEIKKKITELTTQLVPKQNKKLTELESKLLNDFYMQRKAREKSLAELRKELDSIHDDLADIDDLLASFSRQKTQLETELDDLRNQWVEISKSRLDENCPTCGQPWPEQKIEEFNLEKSRKLEQIQAKAEEIKADIERRVTGINTLLEKKKEFEEKQKVLKQQIKDLESEITQMKFDPMQNEQYRALAEDIQKQNDTNQIQKELEKLDVELRDIEAQILTIQQQKSITDRIATLEAEQRELNRQFQNIERQIHLCDRYFRKKAELADFKINSHFENVKFKLFNPLINGTLEPCCEITYQGIPWKNVNSGGRIQAGVEIIKAFQSKLNIYAPVFIDNKETVTDVPPLDCQVIYLEKVEGLKRLHINKGDVK